MGMFYFPPMSLYLTHTHTQKKTFELSLDDLRRRFADRGYPSSIAERAFSEVSKMSQSDALQPSAQNIKNVVPFTIVYNPSLPSIGKTIHKYWDILNLSKNRNISKL